MSTGMLYRGAADRNAGRACDVVGVASEVARDRELDLCDTGDVREPIGSLSSYLNGWLGAGVPNVIEAHADGTWTEAT